MLRNLDSWIVRPSRGIKDPYERDSARLFVYYLLVRVAVALFLWGILHSKRVLVPAAPIALMLNFVAYGVTRTKYWRWGAWLVFLTSLVHVSFICLTNHSVTSVVALEFLGLNIIVSSLVLPIRQSVLLAGLTIATFAYIAVNGPDLNLPLTATILIVSVNSGLVLFGSRLREKSLAMAESERAKAAQASKLAILGEMSGGLAHEINTPLTVIQMGSELIEESLAAQPKIKSDLQTHLHAIHAAVDRISKISYGLKAFARDATHDEHKPLQVKALIESTLIFCKEKFKSHGILLNVDLVEEDARLMGSETQLSQVLLSLIANAYDAILFAPEKWVRIELRKPGERFEIHVVDSGSPIAKETRERLFNPFFTTKTVGQGTGLGLSISKGIMESHGGELEFDPNSRHTRFIMRFPPADGSFVSRAS